MSVYRPASATAVRTCLHVAGTRRVRSALTSYALSAVAISRVTLWWGGNTIISIVSGSHSVMQAACLVRNCLAACDDIDA